MYRDMCKGGEVSRGDALILPYIYFYFQGASGGRTPDRTFPSRQNNQGTDLDHST